MASADMQWLLYSDERIMAQGPLVTLPPLKVYPFHLLRAYVCYLGMVVKDFCANGMTAVSMAEELFPQFGSSEAQCTKDPDHLMLGRCCLKELII